MRKIKAFILPALVNALSVSPVFAAPIFDNKKDWTKADPDYVLIFIDRIKDILLGAAGIVAVAMVIWGGVLYMTSGGNEERKGQGKTVLTYAITGLIIIICSYAIVYVFTHALGGNI